MACLPAIVVIAYNRPDSLNRLLKSLEIAHYDEHSIPLIISIDKSDNPKVYEIAETFEWKYGTKKIIIQPERLGLKNHVLKCGDLAIEYGSIIMLEDDLYVSPYFYNYAQKASEYYKDDDSVAGISLYNHCYNEVALFPFSPIDDGCDVYFLQIASSWGQLFWGSKWKGFLEWYNNLVDITKIKDLPTAIMNWSSNSWKKYFIGYLINTERYFVYPRISLTTNFSDDGGQHLHNSTSINQVPILCGEKNWTFRKFSESDIKYDAYCEIKADYLKKNVSKLADYDFDVDLYGCKPLDKVTTQFLITSKPTKNSIFGYGLNFKAIHANINPSIAGIFFALTKKQSCFDNVLSKTRRKIRLFNFFYRETSIKMYLLLMLNKIFKG